MGSNTGIGGFLEGIAGGVRRRKDLRLQQQEKNEEIRLGQLLKDLSDPNVRPEEKQRLQSQLDKITSVTDTGKKAVKAKQPIYEEVGRIRAGAYEPQQLDLSTPEKTKQIMEESFGGKVTSVPKVNRPIRYTPEEQTRMESERVGRVRSAEMQAEQPFLLEREKQKAIEREEQAAKVHKYKMAEIAMRLDKLNEWKTTEWKLKDKHAAESEIQKELLNPAYEGMEPADARRLAETSVWNRMTEKAEQEGKLREERIGDIKRRKIESDARIKNINSMIESRTDSNRRQDVKLSVQREMAEREQMLKQITRNEDFVTANYGDPTKQAKVAEAIEQINSNFQKLQELDAAINTKVGAGGSTAPSSPGVIRPSGAAHKTVNAKPKVGDIVPSPDGKGKVKVTGISGTGFSVEKNADGTVKYY